MILDRSGFLAEGNLISESTVPSDGGPSVKIYYVVDEILIRVVDV